MTNTVKIVAVLTAKPGKETALQALLDGMLAPSRAEPGNLRYDIWQDQADPTRFVLDELYRDMDSIASHRQTAHFQDYLARIGDLADRTALVLNPVQVG